MVYDIGTKKTNNKFTGGSMAVNFKGLCLRLGNLPALSKAVSRPITFWYQPKPQAPFPGLPGLNDLEVI
jgi:hypothetical protein